MWSLNERLGALCEKLGAGGAGWALPELDLEWASEILEVFRETSDEDGERPAGYDPLPDVPDMSGWDKSVRLD